MGFVVMKTKRSILVMFLIRIIMDPMSLITKRKVYYSICYFRQQTSPIASGFSMTKMILTKMLHFLLLHIIRQYLHTQMI